MPFVRDGRPPPSGATRNKAEARAVADGGIRAQSAGHLGPGVFTKQVKARAEEPSVRRNSNTSSRFRKNVANC